MDEAMALSNAIMRASKLLKAYRHHAPLKEFDLDIAHVPLLFSIESGPIRVGIIAEKVASDISTISRQVTQLTRLGLVTKHPDPNDRRAQVVELTDEGRASLDRMRRQRATWFAGFLHGWSLDDIRSFHSYLERLGDAVERDYLELCRPAQTS